MNGLRCAGCHTTFRLPGRCQPLVHTIDQAKRVWPLWGFIYGMDLIDFVKTVIVSAILGQ